MSVRAARKTAPQSNSNKNEESDAERINRRVKSNDASEADFAANINEDEEIDVLDKR
jgi:hypothetical protein